MENSIFEWMQNSANKGTNQDMIPEGTGEFGYDVTNPIPTNTIRGNIIYLEKLHTDEGVKVGYERLGSTISPNIKGVIDLYLISVDGKELTELYICPYNQKTSNKAPKGFRLIPKIN